MVGRTKAFLKCVAGATIFTIVYIVKGARQSLLEWQDGERLGIVKIKPENVAYHEGQLGFQLNTQQPQQQLNNHNNNNN